MTKLIYLKDSSLFTPTASFLEKKETDKGTYMAHSTAKCDK